MVDVAVRERVREVGGPHPRVLPEQAQGALHVEHAAVDLAETHLGEGLQPLLERHLDGVGLPALVEPDRLQGGTLSSLGRLTRKGVLESAPACVYCVALGAELDFAEQPPSLVAGQVQESDLRSPIVLADVEHLEARPAWYHERAVLLGRRVRGDCEPEPPCGRVVRPGDAQRLRLPDQHAQRVARRLLRREVGVREEHLAAGEGVDCEPLQVERRDVREFSVVGHAAPLPASIIEMTW